MWSKPLGEPLYHTPFLADDQVLFRSSYGNLYSLSVSDGANKWKQPIPNVDEMLGAFNGKLFVRTLSGAFAMIDLESGVIERQYAGLRPSNLIGEPSNQPVVFRDLDRNGAVHASCRERSCRRS